MIIQTLLSYVSRANNKAAHTMVANAAKEGITGLWNCSDIPELLLSILTMDLCNIEDIQVA